MTTADKFDTPSGGTFYGAALTAITEAFDGNGVTSSGDAEATPGSSDMTVDVASGTIRYDGTEYTPSADTLTISSAPTSTTNGQEDRRVDLVVFDSSSGTYTVVEGNPSPNPVPPSVPADGLLIAFVEVGHDVVDIQAGDVLNWRAFPAASYPVETGDLADAAVTEDKVASGAVGTDELQDNAVAQAKVATDAVGTDQLIDAAVTTSIIADAAVTEDKVAPGAVGTDELQDAAITAAKVADGAVDTAAIQDEAITEGKIDPNVDLGGAAVDVEDDRVVIEDPATTINFAEGLTVTKDGTGRVTVTTAAGDEVLAQMLSRRQNNLSATEISAASGVSAPKAQVLARRN